MFASIRDIKGQGNAALFCRFRDATGRYWNFNTSAWDGAESANTKSFLTEYADSDTLESRYQSALSGPTEDYLLEYVRASDNYVIGETEAVPQSGGTVDLTPITSILQRIAGLVGANKKVDQEVLDTKGRVTSARMRVFDRDPNDVAAVLVATYNVVATYSAGNQCTMTVTEVLP
jgi:hypothetical protein